MAPWMHLKIGTEAGEVWHHKAVGRGWQNDDTEQIGVNLGKPPKGKKRKDGRRMTLDRPMAEL